MDAVARAINTGAARLQDMPQTKPPRADNPSCFGSIESACERTMSAASRVERIVNRLCGDPLDPELTGAEPGKPSSLLSAADFNAANISHNMDRIFEAMDRLEKHLP